jgi:uncharacterized protein with HEPN domain
VFSSPGNEILRFAQNDIGAAFFGLLPCLTLDTFRLDSKTFDAVVRNLEIIGEATKGIPDSVRLKHRDVDWKRTAALRNILIHEYFGVDAEIIWDVVQNKLTALEKSAQKILQE